MREPLPSVNFRFFPVLRLFLAKQKAMTRSLISRSEGATRAEFPASNPWKHT
jgi:hypothetical protein